MDDARLAGGSGGWPRSDAPTAEPPGEPLRRLAPLASDPPRRRSRGAVLGATVRALRPRQWVKNLLVAVAPASAGVLDRPSAVLHTLAVFGVACAAASAVYLVNDVVDAPADRLHPVKRRRPVASGDLPVRTAVGVAAMLFAAALAGAWLVRGWELLLVVGIYALSSVAYTAWLKREPVLDLVTVASGFVLRAIMGGVATHVPLSNWLLVVTSFGALFVVTGKRAAEHRRLGAADAGQRPVLALYTASFLRTTLIVTASVTVTAYCLWAFDPSGLESQAGHHFIWIQLTVVPIVIALLYVVRLIDAGQGEAPDELVFHDHLLQVVGVLWVALFAIGIYG